MRIVIICIYICLAFTACRDETLQPMEADEFIINFELSDSTSFFQNWTISHCISQSSSETFVNDAPPEGSTLSVFLRSGSTQGCFPSYAQMELPDFPIQEGDIIRLEAWVKGTPLSSDQSTRPVVQIGLKAKDQEVSIREQPRVNALEWTKLVVQDTLGSVGDSLLVIRLDPGILPGALTGGGFFNQIKIEKL